MSYDAELAERIRRQFDARPDATERKMFGGLAFLINGNMAAAASRNGGLMVRVDPAGTADLLATTPAQPVEMRNREMRGWLHLDAEDVADNAELNRWIDIGVAQAATLPSKTLPSKTLPSKTLPSKQSDGRTAR